MEARGLQISGLRLELKEEAGTYEVTPADPDLDPGLDPSTLSPKISAAFDAFRKGLAELVETSGVTYEDFVTAGQSLVQTAVEEPGMTYLFFDLLLKPVFFPEADAPPVTSEDSATLEQMEGPVYFPGAPQIGNPGVIPMRPDEEGTPLVLSGQVRSTDGSPLVGAEVDVWLCAASGHYSLTGLDDQPDYNLRAIQLTDEEGRYELRMIKPVPYYIPVLPEAMLRMYEGLGYSKFRPRHVHFKFRHADLPEEVTTQLYFKGDPYLNYDIVTVITGPAFESLVIDTELHDDPGEIADRGFDQPFLTGTFDFVLETRVPAKA